MILEKHQQIALELAEKLKNDGNLRSRLRRAKDVSDVIGQGEADHFVSRLAKLDSKRETDGIADDVADIMSAALILLAQRTVKNGTLESVSHNRQTLAANLGQKTGEQRVLSELRFQRLLRASDLEDQLLQMRRALALLTQPAHPTHVLEAFLSLQSDNGRRRFARAYFNGPTEDGATPPSAEAA
jgi:hypothetical protein